MGIFTKKKPAAAKKSAAKPKTKAQSARKSNDDAADTLKRLNDKRSQNPDSCPFC